MPIADDRQREFIELCRSLGIRTVAGFMLGFPDDTRQRLQEVSRYARLLNPTFANFNLVTPYPGTRFYREIRDQIASFDFSRYDVYTPVLKYEHLTADELSRLHARAFAKFFFRSEWLRAMQSSSGRGCDGLHSSSAGRGRAVRCRRMRLRSRPVPQQ